MKCPKCNGRGKTTEYDGLRKFWCDYKCEVCNGTGKVMTEQEWLQTATTEQLAEFLADELNDVVERVLEGVWLNDGDTDRDEYYQRQTDVLEWLKQPHTKG